MSAGGGDEEQGHGQEYKDNTDIASFTESRYITPYNLTKSDNMTILSGNVRSINNKFQDIRDITHKIMPSILCLQEIWGVNPSTDYSIKHYHKPSLKSRQGSTMNLGGGIGFWVRNNIEYDVVYSPFIQKQIETATIKLPKHNMLIVNIYRPFGDINLFLSETSKHIKSLRSDFPHYNICAVGDFNINLLSDTVDSRSLIEDFTLEGFIQTVTLPTRIQGSSKTLIDHVFSRSKRRLHTDVIASELSDHEMTFTTFQNKVKKNKMTVTKRWLKEDHYEEIAQKIGEYYKPFVNESADEAAEILSKVIIKALDEVAPILTKSVTTKKINQWSTTGIVISARKASIMYRKVKRTGNGEIEYKKYKKILKKVIRYAKNSYYENMLKNAGCDTRKIWGILNEVLDRKQCRVKIPSTFKINGEEISSAKTIASAFNKYFTSIGQEMADSIPTISGFEEYLDKCSTRFRLKKLSSNDVSNIMRKQKPKLSCGLDTINNKIVKTSHIQLAEPMTYIINRSIETGIVPSIYKLARVVPLYKKGSHGECGNYRPVSLLPSLSKILEKAICKQLMDYLGDNNLLCQNQFGFRPKNQTSHVVHSMLNYITEKSTENKVTIATFIDLSKAFDCLQYEQLFSKMSSLGFTENTLQWFKSYLTGRRQITDVDGTISDELYNNLGVPQGSILGPILFLIYVNDMNKADPSATFLKFADDTTILTSGNTLQEAQDKMNNTLAKVNIWFQRNKLNLNPSKTRFMLFNTHTPETKILKIGNEFIERVWEQGNEKSFKLVGLQLDEKLKWSHHISYILKKVNSSNYALTKAAQTLKTKNKKAYLQWLSTQSFSIRPPTMGACYARKTTTSSS